VRAYREVVPGAMIRDAPLSPTDDDQVNVNDATEEEKEGENDAGKQDQHEHGEDQ